MFVDNYIAAPGMSSSPGGLTEMFSRRMFDPGLKRPYLDEKGRRCVSILTGRTENRKGDDGKIICNADGIPVDFPVRKKVLIQNLQSRGIWDPTWNATSLRKDDWIKIDKTVLRATRKRMRAWADLAAANTYGGFNGMAVPILEHELMTDPGEAIIDMEGTTESRTDAPKWQLEALPLPITHSDFTFSQRRLAISRNSGTPLDVTMAEAAGRRVGEAIEKMTIGTLDLSSVSFAGTASDYGDNPRIYGYLTAPNRITKTDLTKPDGSNSATTVGEIIAMRELAYAQNFFGPFILYHSTDWDTYLDNDHYVMTTSGAAAPTKTLRQRIQEIEGITAVRRLDFMTPTAMGSTFNLLLVEMSAEVAQAVNGMEVTTMQWEEKGGLELMFKVMCIKVPRIRSQYVENTTTKKTGIVHGTPA